MNGKLAETTKAFISCFEKAFPIESWEGWRVSLVRMFFEDMREALNAWEREHGDAYLWWARESEDGS